ncbi:MAG: FliH/SctL family protein [Planctomycetota bacterium]
MKNSSLRPSTKIQVGRVLRNVLVAPGSGGSTPGAGTSAAAAAIKEAAQQAFEKGLAAGREEARRELASALAAVGKMATALQQEANEIRQKSDRHATLLALRIAAKVVGREVAAAETVQRMVGVALAQVPLEPGLSIRLNPQDAAVLAPLRSKMLEVGVELPEEMTLVSDPGIQRGGCIIDSKLGQVDARLETQLAFIERALCGGDDQPE